MTKNSCLAVIIPDSLQSLYKKGELTTNYYNPNNFFKEVHLITTCKETIASTHLQKTVGNAKLTIHYLPKFLSLSPPLFPAFYYGKWILKGINLIQSINPQLIRIHGHSYPALLGVSAGKKLSIPVVISIHTQPDISWRKRISLLKQPLHKLHAYFHQFVENCILRSGAKIVCVYHPAFDYAIKHKCGNATVLYNCLNIKWDTRKTAYTISGNPKLIVVGRQLQWKKPDKIISALRYIPNATITIIGNGEAHSSLKNLALQYKLDHRCTFLPHVNNDDLINFLLASDIFLHSSLYPEISKSTLEALLVGLPVIHNVDQKAHVQELNENHIYGVKNTVDDYVCALNELINNKNRRESLGRNGYLYAQKNYQPKLCEEKYLSLYKDLLQTI